VRAPKYATKNAPAEIIVAVVPVDNRNQVTSGSFEVDLAVTARNADARRYRVVVNYDGGWGDDVWEHLRVQGPQLMR
jgi:hypothetical protein